jgi:hypothetical protein
LTNGFGVSTTPRENPGMLARVTKKLVVGSFLIAKSKPSGDKKLLFVGVVIVVPNIAPII